VFGQGSVRKNRRHGFIANKGLDSRERVQDGSHDPIRPRQKKSAPERDIENGLCHERHTPGNSVIDARDQDLPGRELQQLTPGAISIRWNETLRNERYPFTRSKRSMRHRIVVAQSALPGITDTNAIKNFTAEGHRTTPREIASVIAKCRHNGRIPRRSKQRRKTAVLRGIPPIATGHGNVVLLQRRNQPLNPLLRKARVGIAEDENFRVCSAVLDTVYEVMYLLPSIAGCASNQNRRVQVSENLRGGIRIGIDNEDGAKIGIVLIENRLNIFAKTGIHTSARAKDNNARTPTASRTIGSDVMDGSNSLYQRDDSLD